MGSCGILVKLFLRISSPISLISIPSIDIFPESASNILNNEIHKVDFPLPVLQTIPIFSYGLILNFQDFLKLKDYLVYI